MFTRDELGKIVRDEWVKFARQDPNSPPHHLISWDALDDKNREVDCRIGEAVLQAVIDKLRIGSSSATKAHGGS